MSNTLGEVIKRMAVGANEANAPTAVVFGTVTNTNPLEITVEQKLKLTKEFLVLTKNVKDYTTEVTVNWNTENKTLNANHGHDMSGDISVSSQASTMDGVSVTVNNTVDSSININQANLDLSHDHNIEGRKQIIIHNALKTGDNVILIQQQGGNNFVVLDKI